MRLEYDKGSGKTSVAAKRINKRKYGALLADALPAVIKTEEENERMLALAEQLIDKGESRTPEEDQLFELVTKLIEDFEEEHYPIPDAPPHRILCFLMEQNDLRQSDLPPIFGSRGYVSDVVNGKRAISETHDKALGNMFHVSPEVFI
jgi:HTH-type transcriptional regulator/antitoxin HigA